MLSSDQLYPTKVVPRLCLPGGEEGERSSGILLHNLLQTSLSVSPSRLWSNACAMSTPATQHGRAIIIIGLLPMPLL